MGSTPTILARPATPRVSLALMVALAIGFLAGGAVGSLPACAAAVAGAVLTWRFGPLIGGIAFGALAAVDIMADPMLIHPMPTKMLVWVVGLMFVGLAAGMIARRDSARAAAAAEEEPDPRPRPSRSGETPLRSARVTGEHKRLKSNPEIPRLVLPAQPPRDRVAGGELPELVLPTSEIAIRGLEHDVVQRFLRDVRDALGADEVALWELDEDTDEVRPYACAVATPETLSIQTKPGVDSLVHAAAVSGVGSNYDNELNYFYAVAAGAEGRFHGALGLYADDRQSFNRDRARQSMRGFTDRLAEILNLLLDGRETRRLRGKVEEATEAIESIQKQREMSALRAEICRRALRLTSGSRAAFITWDAEGNVGSVDHVEPAGITAASVAPTSLAGMACQGPNFKVGRENFTHGTTPLFLTGEKFARPGSAIGAGLHKDGQVVGAIVVIGDQPGQVGSVELNTLIPMARVAYAAWMAVSQLERAQGQAVRDGLTGLHNRRAFDERMSQIMAESDRFGQQTSLILVDVDRFKSINDTYGHAAGDEVLKQLAKTLLAGVRDMDFVARYGGEEVAILQPQTPGKWAYQAADRLRVAVENMKVVFEGKQIPVTASFGVACHPDNVFGQENLFKAADEALYMAKNGGRNCVMMHESSTSKTKS
ncbi:MAG TPA: GGDEF domain-containing protein [Gemmatimonadaceae bacterium]|nr:GGDEF domain-containing protein [Gemmatimonadaceae bacterium]